MKTTTNVDQFAHGLARNINMFVMLVHNITEGVCRDQCGAISFGLFDIRSKLSPKLRMLTAAAP